MNNENLQLAWEEWQAAKNFFENAVEPEDIEYAVYNLEARRRQYTRMLSALKREDNVPLPKRPRL